MIFLNYYNNHTQQPLQQNKLTGREFPTQPTNRFKMLLIASFILVKIYSFSIFNL